MSNRLSPWLTRSPLFLNSGWLRVAALVVSGVVSVGCGAYEPEPEYPQQYPYVAPVPPTAEELAAQQDARAQAAAASSEVLIGADADEYSDTDPSALSEFKPALDGHGTWVDDASYGTVWVPATSEVGADFQPYVSAGHWTYSDDADYVWVSDYSWGWAPFHYGRWVSLPGHGWSWIPGRRYAGAWVTWRTGPTGYGYVGWAPMGPSWYWYNGAAIGWSYGWYHPYDHYVYCPHSYVYHGSVATYTVRGPAAREHYGRTQDYRPASPTVGGGDRTVANPTVNGGGRVVANPTVNGGGRVVANPAVGGSQRLTANPGVKGPRPQELGLGNDSVIPPPRNHQGLSRAQAFATPTTAVAAGAAAPAHLRPMPSVSNGPDVTGRAAGPAGRGPASATFVPRGVAQTSPQPRMSGPPYASPTTPPSAYRTPPNYASPPPPSYRSTSPVVRPPPSYASSPSAPSYRSTSPAVRSTPSFGSSPSAPAFRSSAPAVRSTPSFGSSPSTPSFRSSAPAVRSSPSFGGSRAPSPSFRSSAPAVRSAPSRSSSTPSRSSAPAVRSGGGFRRR